MVDSRMDPLSWLRKQLEVADVDLLREMVRTFAEMLMSAEADAVCGAPYRERSEERVNRRNGYRERDYSPDELDTLRAGAEALGLTPEDTLAHQGATTRDIYLNDVAFWRNVPAGVWSYTIGGYQVMKKWLSYRERSLLGRDLSKDEAREVTAETWAWDRGPEEGGARRTQPA